MKRLIAVVIIVFVLSPVVLGQPVVFNDPALEAAVEAILGPDPTPGDMLGLTTLDAHGLGISDLTGLETATNLTQLELSSNQISDISALSGLTKLHYLRLSINQISDISALSGLTNLNYLFISDNQISNLSPLSGLTTNLWTIYIQNNQISDVSPLSGLAALNGLTINDNQISDVSPLSGLTNLTGLNLDNNQVSDISPLVGLPNLFMLYLQGNPLHPDACAIYIPQMLANNVIVYWDPCMTLIEVPDVVGMSEDSARSEISSAGLWDTVTYMYSDTIAEGIVFGQNPAAGTMVEEGARVDMTVSMGSQLGPPVEPDAGCLLAHWALDDGSGTTAVDSSGNGFDMTMYDNTWEDGLLEGAAHFHGAGYGEVSDVNYSDNVVTLCTWVCHDEFIMNKIERYVTAGNSSAAMCKEYDGRLVFYVDTDDNLRHLLAEDVLTEGQWHHIAGTWDGLKQRLYIDGDEIANQQPESAGSLCGIPNVTLSSEAGPFNGMLDDVRIYGCALSINEIRYLAGF